MNPNEQLDLPKSYGVVAGVCLKMKEGGAGATSNIVKVMIKDPVSPAY